MKVLWICGLPEEVRVEKKLIDVSGAAWSWILGHLPPPEGVELHVICPVHGLKTEGGVHFEWRGAVWHCFELKRWEPLFLRRRFYRTIKDFVKKLRPDVVHGWGGESGCGLLATYCSEKAIVSVQGQLRMLNANARQFGLKPEFPWWSISARFREFLEVVTYRRARVLLAESEASQKSLWELYGQKSEVIRHPLRREFLVSGFRFQVSGEGTYLFVGQMVARKGPVDAIKAFAGLWDADARLVMIGSGGLDAEIDQFILERGLGNRITRIPQCSAAEVVEWMQKSRYFILPSYGDTGPTAMLEAISQGMVPICYDNTGPGEIVRRYGVGSAAKTGEVGSLVSGCKFQVENVRGAAMRVREEHSREAAWDGLMKVYAAV